jgi:hypothetical protein
VKKKASRLILALTVLATLAAAYFAWRYWQLAHDGTTTTALSLTVDRRLIVSKTPTGLPYQYSAAYTFADRDGTVHRGRQTIDRSRYVQLADRAPHTPVTITYSRSNPDVNSLDPNAPRNVAMLLGLLALVGWGVVLFRNVGG